jgi:hypothetical protein
MTALEQLNAYLEKLEWRMRIFAISRGAAIVTASAVLLTVLLAWLCNLFAFAGRIVWPVRILLYLSVAGAIVFGLVVPLLRMNRRWVARRAEQRLRDFNERLLTLTERGDPANPFTELLAEDALRIAQQHEPRELAPSLSLTGFLASGLVAAGVLLWLIVAAPGYWGYGASLLWAGTPRSNGPLYDILVNPGDKIIRRRSDQLVTAQLHGFSADRVTLYARYGGAPKWETVAMQPQRDGSGYEFLFAGLGDSVEYYVAAGVVKSKAYKIGVKDLPSVKKLRVTVHYPRSLGLEDKVDDPGGDVRAVIASEANIAVLTDKPLDLGVLVLENGHRVTLSRGEGNWLAATLPVNKDGSYHVAALDTGDAVRLTDDYFIEARNDEPPSVKIVNPGHDARVTPIEELPVSVEASDDFGLKKLELHYSVNGGAEKIVTFGGNKSQNQLTGKAMLSMEDYKLVPGDLVSFYATAKDASTTARTDMFFAQAEPFDLKFQQSQQAGGGGGGAGNESSQISERQKEIIAATWNEIRNGAKDQAGRAEESRFLSDVEAKLGEQAKTLADRMRSRELAGSSPEFEDFSKQMDRASDEINKAVDQLKGARWNEALPPEQRALQSLMRAESLFRNIQVAFGRMGSGGGAGSAGRDLERMFDLELDTEKNQYETGDSASSQNRQQQALDDAFQRLKALAQRQQELAASRKQQQAFEQRWQQEMLRREAEQLQREMQQLAQNQQGQEGSTSAQPRDSQGGASSSSANSRQGRQSRSDAQSRMNSSGAGQNSQLQQAMDALKRAQQDMRDAVSNHDESAQQRAASELQTAQNLLSTLGRQQAGSSLSNLNEEAQKMVERQKDFASRLRQEYSRQANNETEQADSGVPSLSGRRRFSRGWWNRDPNDPRYSGAPANRTPQSDRLAQEKASMADDLEQMERQLQRNAQNFSGSRPDVASKLRDAIEGIQQQDLTSRMKKNAEWIRQGYGAQTWVNEQSMTPSLEQLARQVQQARAAAEKGEQARGPQQGDGSAQALAQVQQLKRDLAQMQRNGSWSPFGSGQPSINNQQGAVQDAMQNLAALRQQLSSKSGRAYYDAEYALRFLHDLEGASPAELSARLDRVVLPSLERLEVDLQNEMKHPPASGRVAGPEDSPEAYRDAIAAYFRKLSQ